MNDLNLSIINISSPYKVWEEDGEYRFLTDSEILYAMGFDKDMMGKFMVYWFNLINRSHIHSPNDVKLGKTVAIVIEEFFRVNPDVLLYLCDSAKDQQAMRARLFKRWFSKFDTNGLFDVKSAIIQDEDVDNYISMIIPKHHPQYNEIVTLFADEVERFSNMK